MANSAQSRKRAFQAEKRRKRNVSLHSMVRTYIKKTLQAIDAGKYEAAQSAYQKTVSALDKLANKGIITKNKAARHKHRLNKQVHALKQAWLFYNQLEVN